MIEKIDYKNLVFSTLYGLMYASYLMIFMYIYKGGSVIFFLFPRGWTLWYPLEIIVFFDGVIFLLLFFVLAASSIYLTVFFGANNAPEQG